jgi:hypothetical protein
MHSESRRYCRWCCTAPGANGGDGRIGIQPSPPAVRWPSLNERIWNANTFGKNRGLFMTAIPRPQTAALLDRILRPHVTSNIQNYVARLSILDLAPVRTGGTIAEAYRNTVDLALLAERWLFTRFWLAEHHNMPGIASPATSVLIGHVAGKTSTIRVGSGGVMLPNHSPLVMAEQFGTLEALYPGRIDLGVGPVDGFHHAQRNFGAAAVQDAVQVIQQQ